MTSAEPNFPDAQAATAARRVVQDSGRVADPFATAEIFPAEAYAGEAFWRFERWAVFEREWLCVGHVNQVPNPGDHFAISVIDEPLLVTRDEAGEIHVLSAICQHRGHPLMDGLDAPAKPGTIRNAKRLICPYHAWSYRLDGTLHAAPAMARTISADHLRRGHSLPRIRHEIFCGLIFINFDPDALALAPSLTKMEAMIRGYGLDQLLPRETATMVLKSNWKIYQENSLEPYHTDVVHRRSHSSAPAHLSAFYDYEPGDGAILTTTGFSGPSALFDADGAAGLPQIPGLSEVQQNRILFVAVLPSLFLVLDPGSVIVNLVFPTDAATMTRSTFALYPREATQAAGFDVAAQAQTEALKGIVAEDWATQEALQGGHASRFTPKGRLSWLETTIPQMNSWLLRRYTSGLERLTGPPAPDDHPVRRPMAERAADLELGVAS